jgi:hypothetical protein
MLIYGMTNIPWSQKKGQFCASSHSVYWEKTQNEQIREKNQ